MNLPTPTTVLGRALERAVIVGIAAAITYLLGHVELSPIVYFGLKTLSDTLNKNVPNL